MYSACIPGGRSVISLLILLHAATGQLRLDTLALQINLSRRMSVSMGEIKS